MFSHPAALANITLSPQRAAQAHVQEQATQQLVDGIKTTHSCNRARIAGQLFPVRGKQLQQKLPVLIRKCCRHPDELAEGKAGVSIP
jgi:hypothetical protein